MSRTPYTGLATRVSGITHRIFVLVLLLSFVLTPLSPVFAQEAPVADAAPASDPAPSAPAASEPETPVTPDTPATPDTALPAADAGSLDVPVGTTDDQTAPAPETSADVVIEPTVDLPTDDAATPEDALITDKAEADVKAEELDTTAKDQQMMTMSSSDPQAPSVAMPSFTYQSIAPKVDKANGALTQSVKLAVPPGRNGMNPDLALTYNSQNLDESIVGYGWSVNIPYIERINRYGTNELYNHSKAVFTSSFSGELASTTTFNEYRAKVDEGDFLKYTFSTSTATGGTWTVYDKQGTRYIFGINAQARQDNSADTSKVTRWMLEEVRDTNNNFIRYEYYKDANQIYPSKVYYTGSGSTDGIFTVEFARETRPDIITSYRTRFLVTTNYRITEITAKMNGTLVRKYTLGYTSGNNTKRSLLASITEMGQNESGSGTLTLPPVTFEYINDTPTFESGAWTQINDIRVVADANGDGFLDINLSYLSDGGVITNDIVLSGIGNIYGSYYPEYWASNAGASSIRPRETGTRFVDVNGDGLPDVVRSQTSVFNATTTISKKMYQNTSTSSAMLSWVLATSSLSAPDFAFEYQQGEDVTLGILGNLNGDGVIDFERAHSSGNPAAENGGYLGTGSSFSKIASAFAPKENLPSLGSVDTANNQLIDINGDGLDDWFKNEGTVSNFYLNNGTGWNGGADARWGLATTTVTQTSGQDRGIRFADINGDGLPDYVRSYLVPTYTYPSSGLSGVEVGDVREVKINTGSGWATSTIALPSGTRIVNGYVEASWLQRLDKYEMWDSSGDGLADVYGGRNTARKPDMLKKITYATGGNTEIEYTPTTQQFSSNHPKHVNLPYMLYTVTKLTTNDGKGNQDVATYTYENGDFYFNTPYDRKIAGFESIAEDHGGTLTKTYYYQGNTASTTLGEFNDHVSKIGKAYREDVMASSTGALYKRTFYTWDNYDQGYGRNIIALTKTLEQTFDGDADHKDKAANYTYDTANGNLIQKIDWGEVTGNSDGTFTDTGSDRASTTITYVASSSVNLWLPKQETAVDQSLTKVKETKYYYDALAHGSVGKGNETKRESWVTGTSYIDTEKTYNSYGLVTQEKDPRDKATNYTYDTYNLYPASVTNPLSHVTSYTYDYSSGKPLTVTDPNTRVFQYLYDPVDRLIEEKQPDHTTPSTLVTKATYAYTDTPNSKSILKTSYLDGSNTALEYTYFDGLDRVIQKRTEAEDANTFSVTDRVYNNRGLLWKESLPYFSSGSANTTPTGTSALYTTYTYDVMQRPTTIARVVGNETRTYDDWKTTITDPRGNPKSLYSDARGNLKQVDEINNGQTYTTVYDWNLLNSLTRITDAENNVRNFTYDGLGRRLTAQDLHAQADGTYGTWTYAYDAAGNIATTTDPKSQVVVRTYDDLNRPLTENYTGAAGTEATFTYDTCTDGKGRLCRSVFTGSATSTYLYTPLGQVKAEGKLIVGTSTVATTTYEYNRQGNTTKITTPDNAQVTYAYNIAGLLETVQRKEAADGSYTNVVTDFDYAPTGAITYTAYANGASTANTYDANELYRLRSKVTTAASSTRAQDLTYTYDANGNITRIIDASQTTTAKTADYGYDALNRLTNASTTGATSGQNYRHTYAYSPLGNITSVGRGSSTSTYAYAQTNYANPHAATAIGVSTGSGGGTSTTTTHTLYAEALGSGWEDWSWDTTINPANTSPVRTGTYSLSSNHTVAWGGMYLHHAGVSTTGSTHLTFSVRSPAAGTYIELESYGSGDTLLGNVVLNDYIPGGTMAANTWYDVSIPLSALGASNTTFTGLVAMRSTTGYVYWDDMKLVNVSAGGGGSSATTTLSYDNAGNLTTMGTTTYAWNYRNMLTQSGNGVATSTYAYDTDGARLKLTEAGVTTYFPSKYYEVTGTSTTKHISAGDLLLATVQNGGSSGGTSTTTTATIYDDATTWNDWSWDTTVNLNETTTVYSGTKSLKATYTAAWGGLYLQNSAGPSTAGATHLHFAVRSSTADPDVEIDAYGPGDNLLGYATLDTYIPSMAANTWYVVDIPLSAIGATNTTLTGFSALRGTTGVLYFDEVRLVAAGSGGGSASTTVRYVHTDHLNSTNVVTSNTGAIVQTLDYYPYGASRVNDSVGGADEKRKYIGQYVDAVSSLSYLNARYYEGSRGQFLSQDPVFIGDPKDMDLTNPQSLNSYSYALNNPISNKDPNGEQAQAAALAGVAAGLTRILAGLAALSASGAALASPQAQQSLSQISQSLNRLSMSIMTTTIGITSSFVLLNGAQAAPQSSIIGGTAVTTPYAITLNDRAKPNIVTADSTKGTPKPVDAPSGSKPIDRVGLPRDVIHDIKNDIGARPNDWTGVTPEGDVITAGPDGKTINHGPVDSWK